MQKIDLGQAIGILANVGVIVGIGFLAVEIRESTIATQAASLQTASEMDQEFLMHVGGDAEAARLWITYLQSPGLLSEEERIQAGFLFASVIRRLENIYLQYQLGALSEEGWRSRRELFEGIARSPGYSAFLEGPTISLANRQFMEYMDELRAGRGE